MERGKKNIKYSMKIKMFNSHFTAKGADLWVYKKANIKVMMLSGMRSLMKHMPKAKTTKQIKILLNYGNILHLNSWILDLRIS